MHDFKVRWFLRIRLQTLPREKKKENIREQNFKPKVRLCFEANILHKVFALTH